MNQLYEFVEKIRDVLATKFMHSYKLEYVYKAIFYAFIHVTLQRKFQNYEILKPLERKIPTPLLAAVKKELTDEIYNLTKHIDSILDPNKPVLTYSEANIDFVINKVKHEIGNVHTVLIYDCMSLIEQLAISAFLKVKGIKTLFLNAIFLNPIGLTKFMTEQLQDTRYQQTLFGVARHVARQLNASLYSKNSFIDEKVHETGLLGVEEFIDRIAIDRITSEIIEKSIQGKTLLFSDHGYDVIASTQNKYIYVLHGFKQRSSINDIPLLTLSRISFFMEANRIGEFNGVH